mmetsp:Transcript_7497/g.11211  ORF Transcript_7497/g.11211 Transcript_7497/m.11211 type:complete len:110 (+) Transcript_7497:23-352(+)
MPPRPPPGARPIARPVPRRSPGHYFVFRGRHGCCRPTLVLFFVIWIVLVLIGGEVLSRLVSGNMAYLYIGVYSSALLILCFWTGYFCKRCDEKDSTIAEKAPILHAENA